MTKNIVDSCGWLEYFANGKNADFFAPVIESTKNLFVPTIIITEVFKSVLRQRSEREAFESIETMLQGEVVEFNLGLSLEAAKLGAHYKMPLADSIILATGLTYDAIIWTQDADFNDKPQVKYIKK